MPTLIGMFDSPFVRRVAVTMDVLGIAYEHANWSVGADFERIRRHNPLGRVPTLVLDDGASLIESSAILDYLDESVGDEPAGGERALLPRAGRERRDALRIMALASGAAEKAVLQVYERVFRPEERRHEPWVERCALQMRGALDALEQESAARARAGASPWWIGGRLTQADITSACIVSFIEGALPGAMPRPAFASLRSRAAACEALPAFARTRTAFAAPAST